MWQELQKWRARRDELQKSSELFLEFLYELLDASYTQLPAALRRVLTATECPLGVSQADNLHDKRRRRRREDAVRHSNSGSNKHLSRSGCAGPTVAVNHIARVCLDLGLLG